MPTKNLTTKQSIYKKIKNIIAKNVYKITRFFLIPSYPLEKLFPNAEKLHPIKPETVPTPEFKQIENEGLKFDKAIHKEDYSLPAIYTANLSEVIYYPRYDLIFTKSGKIIKETISTLYYLNPYQILDLIKKVNIKFTNLFHFASKPEKISGTCSLIREYGRQKNHAHTLVDIIPKIYLLNQPEYQNIDEIKLLFSSEPTNTERFLIEKLAPQNIKLTVVENAERLYSIDKLIFSTKMTRSTRLYLPQEYIEYFRRKVLPKRESKKVNRIFISRSKARHRRMINEAELFEALKSYGFKKYFLEDMSVEDEIELFYDAEYVVGTFGAGQANIIFSRQIKVLEIFANEYFMPDLYYLAKSLGHTYRYYNGYCAGLDSEKKLIGKDDMIWYKRTADFRVNVSEVVECLLELEKQHQF
ncbi:MAG: glycosyltransferase family 61 protein [Coleofasciculus sp. G1-WW12-02]|uniref:glycosyltransferase family 61 protein n=1 Tax=Coleofasciculus sp. G1-WW12-02 TaxID=3068483 RepID=UPI0032F6171B